MIQKSDQFEEINTFRKIFSQALVIIPENLLFLNAGFMLALPTIIIPALSGLNLSNNPNEQLTITPAEASWIGKYSNIII